MKTIDNIINDTNSSINIYKQIERDERVAEYYRKFPELQRIDHDIVESRNDRLLSVIDMDEEREQIFEQKEIALLRKRDEYIAKNGIDANFDEPKDKCDVCHDTGYYINSKGTRQVCKCRQEDLEYCYKLSGMQDYSTYTLKSFNSGFGAANSKRNKVLNGIISLIKAGCGDKSLYVYSDAPGTGKTYLAICATKVAISCGLAALFDKCENLDSLEDEQLEDYKNCEFLILDDYVGELTRKGALARALNEILESRIAANRTTILVTSASVDSIIMDSDARISAKLNKAEQL